MLLEKFSNARGVSGNEAEVREILIDAITKVTSVKDRVRVARDRAWLTGPDGDLKWREHLMDVVKADENVAT